MKIHLEKEFAEFAEVLKACGADLERMPVAKLALRDLREKMEDMIDRASEGWEKD